MPVAHKKKAESRRAKIKISGIASQVEQPPQALNHLGIKVLAFINDEKDARAGFLEREALHQYPLHPLQRRYCPRSAFLCKPIKGFVSVLAFF